MYLQAGVSLLFIFMLFSFSSRAERTCGEARILSGNDCPSLRVQFNLSDCGITSSEEARITCQKGRADAVLATDKNTFHVPLRELSPGVWATIGSLREYPKGWQPPKEPKTIVIHRPSPPSAEPGSSTFIDVGGSFRLRTEQNHKTDFTTEREFSSARLRADFFFYPTESVMFLLEPQANQTFGKPFLSTATTASNIPVATSGANLDPSLTFHQAYSRLRLSQNWSILLGRQIFSYGDEVLVGPSDWDNPGRSFDGFRSRLEWGFGWWDIFTAKLWESSSQGMPNGDKDFHGTYAEWRTENNSLSLQPYLFWLRDRREILSDIYTFGLHLQIAFSGFEIKAEASGQWGSTSGQQAWAQIKTDPFTRFRAQVSVDAFWASSEFNPLFPSVHHWLGWTDVLSRRNLAGIGMGATFYPYGPVEFTLRGLHFLRANMDSPAFKLDGTTQITSAASEADQTVGSEIDAIVRGPLLNSVDFLAAASVFFPGNYVRPTYTDKSVMRLEASLQMKF